MKRLHRPGVHRATLYAAMACLVAAVCPAAIAGQRCKIRPPLWVDNDMRPIPEQPKERLVSELYAIVYNSWFRSLNLEQHVVAARDRGSLNVNAWDEVPDSSWFNNRIGRKPMSFSEILDGLQGKPPESGRWNVDRIRDEGYTPKVDITDASGERYVLKFDLAEKPERNSAAERICTLIMHAAGYNVPFNSIVFFRPEAFVLHAKSYYRDALGNRRPMTREDLNAVVNKLRSLPDGRYRGMASHFLNGIPLGPFVYVGTRKDDPNDLIPHELRRELRGMRVIASWINHADVKDVNALDLYVEGKGGGKYVKHYMLDFGSTLGSGDFIHGPYRVGHEYIYDGAAIAHSFITFGFYRRPWEEKGRILYPEVGYYQAELFEPEKWKPNYPNLAFLRSDDSDCYWGAKIVTAFSDDTIRRLAQAGEYTRSEVTGHVEDVLKRRRDAIGNYWLDRITPLEDIRLDQGSLRFRDLALERGYADRASRAYRLRVFNASGKETSKPGETKTGECVLGLPQQSLSPIITGSSPDRYGRRPAVRLLIQSNRRDRKWALPVEVILGYSGDQRIMGVLGWSHVPK
ncbi:MAG: hypothetical protein HXY20_05730 [Acidobacteria bacterium]|nr:hypothetical protein [Acidobacteriota bacterium]